MTDLDPDKEVALEAADEAKWAVVEFDGVTGRFAAELRPLLVPVVDLRTMPGNPRRGDVDAVVGSYRTFGQRKPVVAQADGTVIDGNHQLLAARQMGWSHLAVVRVDEDEIAAKAYSLAANRTGELGGYDDAELLAMLESVAVDEALLSVTAWSEKDMKRLRGDVIKPDRRPQRDQFMIMINAKNEEEQLALIERFTAEGLDVRAVLS